MAKCSFCNGEVEVGCGVMFVTNEGKIMHFCSSKCRKAFKHGRGSKKLGWTTKKKK